MLKHLASFLLLALMVVLAVGSSDSGSGGGSSNSTGAGASDPPAMATGQDKRISGDHRFGCSDRDYLDKLVRYAVQHDDQAFSQGLAAGLLAGTCTMFKSGEEVYLADTAIFSGLVKVRRKGEMQEYWTNMEAVR
jgi:hypothetical protein